MDDLTVHIESLGIDGSPDEDGVAAALQADQSWSPDVELARAVARAIASSVGGVLPREQP
jgi:hypothetical protein